MMRDELQLRPTLTSCCTVFYVFYITMMYGDF